nr:MAG TPA_asm: hypothetical protein [Caudoviricetes sp.]
MCLANLLTSRIDFVLLVSRTFRHLLSIKVMSV